MLMTQISSTADRLGLQKIRAQKIHDGLEMKVTDFKPKAVLHLRSKLMAKIQQTLRRYAH